MKLIIAIIQPNKLEEVKEELYKEQVNLITVSEVLGHGRQMGVTEIYRGAKETGNLLRKIRLEIAVNEDFVEPTIKAIIKGAKTQETGDGKIFVLDLKECVRIRTEERSEGEGSRLFNYRRDSSVLAMKRGESLRMTKGLFLGIATQSGQRGSKKADSRWSLPSNVLIGGGNDKRARE